MIENKEAIYMIPSTGIISNVPNGFSVIKNKNIWTEFNNGLYVDVNKQLNNRTMMKLMPYILVTNNFKEFLVVEDLNTKEYTLGYSDYIYNDDGFNEPLLHASSRIFCANFENLSSKTQPLKHVGYIRNIEHNNNLYIVFEASYPKLHIQSKFEEKTTRSHWMSKNELIDKYRKFDDVSRIVIDGMI